MKSFSGTKFYFVVIAHQLIPWAESADRLKLTPSVACNSYYKCYVLKQI